MTTPYTHCIPESDEPLSEILSAAAKIDSLDIAAAVGRISGKQSVLESVLSQTAFTVEERLQKMNTCLSNGDLRGFSIEAHGLKSVLAAIGAVKHASLASELEIMSKSGDAPACEESFSVFSDFLRSLAERLIAIFPEEKNTEKPKGDIEFLFRITREAARYLANFETDDALSCINKLETLTFGDETDALLIQIRNKINVFKYDDALLLLRSIIGC